MCNSVRAGLNLAFLDLCTDNEVSNKKRKRCAREQPLWLDPLHDMSMSLAGDSRHNIFCYMDFFFKLQHKPKGRKANFTLMTEEEREEQWGEVEEDGEEEK